MSCAHILQTRVGNSQIDEGFCYLCDGSRTRHKGRRTFSKGRIDDGSISRGTTFVVVVSCFIFQIIKSSRKGAVELSEHPRFDFRQCEDPCFYCSALSIFSSSPFDFIYRGPPGQ